MTCQIEKKELVIRIPLTDPIPSKTGKSLVVASSHGIVQTECQIGGKAISVGVNAFIKNDAFVKA